MQKKSHKQRSDAVCYSLANKITPFSVPGSKWVWAYSFTNAQVTMKVNMQYFNPGGLENNGGK